MQASDYINVEIPGHDTQAVPTNHLPPVGTQIVVDKHLADGGTYMKVEVTSHEWRLNAPGEEGESASFSITVHTRRV